MSKSLSRWALAAAIVLFPSLAQAQFGSFVPQAISTQNFVNAVSDAAQAVRGAQPVIDEAIALAPSRLAIAERTNRLALVLADGGVSLWRLDLGREVRRLPIQNAVAVALSADGRILVIGHGDGSVDLWDAERGQRQATVPSGGDPVRRVAFSADGTLILIEGAAGSRVVGVGDGVEKTRAAGPATLHPSRPLLAATTGAGITLSDIATGQPLWTVDGTADRLAFTSDGATLLAADSEGTIRIIDAANGRVSATAQAGFAPVALSAGIGTALVAGPGEMRLLDLAVGTFGPAITPHAKPIADALLLRGGSLVLSASADASVRVTDPRSAEVLGQMVVGRSGWAVVATTGQFDAENDGLDAVAWAAGENRFALEQFSDSHFQPGILPRLLTRGEIKWRQVVVAKAAPEQPAAPPAAVQEKRSRPTAKGRPEPSEAPSRAVAAEAARVAEDSRKAEEVPAVVVSKEFAMPPRVAFETPKSETSSDTEDLRLAFAIQDLGGGVAETRLFQNGKLVFQEAGAPASFSAKLVQGANEFRLVALSRERIESRPAKVKVTFAGTDRRGTLHVVAVGINAYRNPALNLNYGAGDARGIADYFTRQPRNLYTEVAVHALYDDQATKANIIGLLDSLHATKPEDSVVIYLAGHGDTLDDGWYFMAADVRYPEREADVRAHGLSSAEISAEVKAMPAQKILMLVDACKSGAALVAFRGFEDRKALMQVARVTGVHVVAATGKDQFAAELTQLGHGVFTYTLLEGLSGKADYRQRRQVTARGLTGYVEDRLPEISQSYMGVAQFPVIDSHGMDFPVAIY